MDSLIITLETDGELVSLLINKVNGLYEILFEGQLLAALRPPGEDWQLLTMEDFIEELPVFENDLKPRKTMKLHAAQINEVIGKIENHWSEEI